MDGHARDGPLGVEDPAAYVGPPEAQKQVFRRIYSELEARIESFARLPLDDLDPRPCAGGWRRSAAADRSATRALRGDPAAEAAGEEALDLERRRRLKCRAAGRSSVARVSSEAR